VDGDGTLNYEEFLAAMVHAGKLDREELLQQVFEQFDTDGSGSITRDELKQVWRVLAWFTGGGASKRLHVHVHVQHRHAAAVRAGVHLGSNTRSI
jgi:Ca2+-binding EF-hand superfamily protein